MVSQAFHPSYIGALMESSRLALLNEILFSKANQGLGRGLRG